MRADALLLPPGSRLLHVGPHSTRAAALQRAFHVNRREIAAQGVHYAGPNREPLHAAQAITGNPSPYANGKTPPRKRWDALAREVDRASESRVVISSEEFADADDAAARTVITDLGGERVHVVVTLRPLVGILPEQWQRDVQGGMTLAYEAWLEALFNKPASAMSSDFWRRHRQDQLVRRWVMAAHRSRVSVVVVDEANSGHVLRVFERLTGLRAGTLVPEPDVDDRSLTFAEIETIRAFNIAFRRDGLGPQLHARVMRYGAAEWLKRRRAGDDEPRIETPAWAIERAGAIEREIVDGIRASGVRVIGDLEALAPATAPPGAAKPTPDETWARVGATAAVGILLASGLGPSAARKAGLDKSWPDGQPRAGPPPPRARAEPIELARVSTSSLAAMVCRRVAGAFVARLTPWRRRG